MVACLAALYFRLPFSADDSVSMRHIYVLLIADFLALYFLAAINEAAVSDKHEFEIWTLEELKDFESSRAWISRHELLKRMPQSTVETIVDDLHNACTASRKASGLLGQKTERDRVIAKSAADVFEGHGLWTTYGGHCEEFTVQSADRLYSSIWQGLNDHGIFREYDDQ